MKKIVKKRVTSSSNFTEKVAKPRKTSMGLTLVVEPGDQIRVTVSQANGTISGVVRGTLIIGTDGVEFRWANCKKATGRVLSWDILTKLMQSGLL